MRRFMKQFAAIGCAVALAAPASAQQPAYFLPGLNEGSGIWSTVPATLASTFNISAYAPGLPNTSYYETQRNSLGSLSTSSLLIGHSNGGVVARLKAQADVLDAVVTYGSPNFGAPLMETYPLMSYYLSRTVWDVAIAIDTYAPNYGGLLDNLIDDENWGTALLSDVMNVVIGELGFSDAEVAAEMGPGSTFMHSILNNSTNVASEQAHLRAETSVVFVTDDFFDNGIFKLMSPSGNSWGNIIQALGAAMDADGAYIYLTADPNDTDSIDLANRLLTAGEDIANIDWAWCTTVSQSLVCWENDEVLPTFTQDLGRGTIPTTVVTNGPVHLTETDVGGSVLPSVFDALGVVRR